MHLSHMPGSALARWQSNLTAAYKTAGDRVGSSSLIRTLLNSALGQIPLIEIKGLAGTRGAI